MFGSDMMDYLVLGVLALIGVAGAVTAYVAAQKTRKT
jgi:hypothetical protein